MTKRKRRIRPNLGFVNEHSEAIVARAFALAEDGREDPEAVKELRRLARSSTRDLEAAECAVSSDEHHSEVIPNRALRLLRAAIENAPASPVAPEDQQLIARIEQFKSLSPSAQWMVLSQLQPPLQSLEQAVIDRKVHTMSELNVLLDRLVGPDSNRDDAFMRSREAVLVAADHLVPLLKPPEPVPIPQDARATLWENVRDPSYRDHCIVCGEPMKHEERWVTVYQRMAIGINGHCGNTHHRCWHAGIARARAEGVGWSDGNARIDPSSGRRRNRR